jgi:hypothetical protein
MPSSASLSILGVFINGFPKQLGSAKPMSSMKIKSMFGGEERMKDEG